MATIRNETYARELSSMETVRAVPKRLSLRRNISWAFAGNVFYAACQWGMITVMAKAGSPEMVGLFALGIAVTQPIMLFAGLHLRTLYCTDTENTYEFRDYLGLRIAGIAIAITVSSGIAFWCYDTMKLTAIIVAMAFAMGAQWLSDLYYGLFQKHERLDRLARSMVLKGVTSFLLIAVIVVTTGQILWAIIGLGACRLLVVILHDMPTAKTLLRESTGSNARTLNRPRFRFRSMLPLVWLALPMGLNMTVLSYVENIPRYYLEMFSGPHALGIFCALAYVMVACTTVTGALGQASLPRFAEYYANRDTRAFSQLLLKLLGIALAMGLAAIATAYFAGRPLLTLLYTPEYAEYHELLLLVIIAGVFGMLSSLLGVALTAARAFRIQPVMNLVSCALVFVASVLLIPKFGLEGAGIAAIISQATAMALFALCVGLKLHSQANSVTLV